MICTTNINKWITLVLFFCKREKSHFTRRVDFLNWIIRLNAILQHAWLKNFAIQKLSNRKTRVQWKYELRKFVSWCAWGNTVFLCLHRLVGGSSPLLSILRSLWNISRSSLQLSSSLIHRIEVCDQLIVFSFFQLPRKDSSYYCSPKYLKIRVIILFTISNNY